MRRSVTASLFLVLGLILPVRMSFAGPPEDLEGSGYELDSSGSGSGDSSEPEADELEKDQANNKDGRLISANSGSRTTLHGSSVLNFDKDGGSGFIILANSKSVLERKDVFAAVIAGGLVGVALAAALVALLIYSRRRKDNGGHVQNQQRTSDYHRRNVGEASSEGILLGHGLR